MVQMLQTGLPGRSAYFRRGSACTHVSGALRPRRPEDGLSLHPSRPDAVLLSSTLVDRPLRLGRGPWPPPRARRIRRPFLVILLLLVGYELVEIALTLLATRVFLPEVLSRPGDRRLGRNARGLRRVEPRAPGACRRMACPRGAAAPLLPDLAVAVSVSTVWWRSTATATTWSSSIPIPSTGGRFSGGAAGSWECSAYSAGCAQRAPRRGWRSRDLGAYGRPCS